MAQSTPSLNKSLRTSPHNIEAERALIGAIMLKPDIMHDTSVTIYPESFYADKHRVIYDAILSIFMKGDPIDLLSVTTRLKEKDQLERVGGATYITELAETVPAAGNAHYYAELVQNKAILRGLILAAEDIAELAYGDPESLDETLDIAEKKVYSVTNTNSGQKFKTLGSSLTEAWERFEYLNANQDERRGVPSGFNSIDSLLSGFQKSDLIILAARPSMGKTTFALDIARNAALKYKASVGIFSLEMSDQQLVDRMLAAEAGVDSWKLRTGKLSTDAEYEAVQAAMAKLADAPIHIDDQPGTNLLQMRSSARRLKNEHGLDLLIVDYLQLIHPTNTKASDNMVQQVTEISRSLKLLARELNVPVIALSQLSRAVEQRGGKPRLSDLRDSGSIEQDADVVMFIHREDKINKDSDRPNIAEIMVEKHRNGPVGMAELYFDAQHVRFLNLDTKHGGMSAAFSDNSVNDDF
ncbi:MAG: replicative DNA helicase [Parcubacteria group bacterium CG2_30_44_11]|nr:MAG: replicative DNA helicase [Parcubacteria group bacterium CG2_30_44_11]